MLLLPLCLLLAPTDAPTPALASLYADMVVDSAHCAGQLVTWQA